MKYAFLSVLTVFALQLNAQCDSVLIKLKANESRAVNAFTSIRDFHLGLMEEIGGASQVPYNRLDSLFKEMKFTANAAIMERTRLEDMMQSMTSAQCDSIFPIKQELLKEMWAQNNLASNQYQSMCAAFGVMRLDKYHLIDRIYKYTIQMQDSLELQYKIIADAKRALENMYPEKKGKAYFEKYAPISEMEAIFKKMEGNIIQLENLQSRIEDSNGALYYWSGPFIPPRQEVAVGDQIVSQCILLHKDFLEQKKKFDALTN